MSKLLIVDDEINIRELIKKYASFEGYEVVEALDGIEAIEKCKNEDFDIVIMDVMMPELDGFSAVKEIRKTKNIPIIMLSARGEEYDRLHGFDLGIDDYVVKPFSPKELMMRLNAILTRYRANYSVNTNKVYVYEGLKIDYSARIVYVNDERLDMTPKEYDLLTYLIKNENMAIKREELLSKVWGYDFFGDDRTLDTHMKLLRRKLGEYGKNIITLRGVGYRFEKK
jgi:DNA-binding response OmpR family regulator